MARSGSRELEGLSSYLRAVRKYPPLAREEEHLLAVRARRGDASAGQKLVRHNLALVVHIVRKQYRGTKWIDDLVQEGNLGLMRAAQTFDPNAGTRFSTYAVWWIRAFLGRCLRGARSAVRPRASTPAQPDVSLDVATSLGLIEDTGLGPEMRFLSEETDRAVRDAIAKVRDRISKRGWDILYGRLQVDSPKTLAEIARSWNVSRERVRQVERNTRLFLREALEPVIRETG